MFMSCEFTFIKHAVGNAVIRWGWCGCLGAKTPAARGIGDLGAELPTTGDFYDFTIKLSRFYTYLGLNFCFKTYLDDS